MLQGRARPWLWASSSLLPRVSLTWGLQSCPGQCMSRALVALGTNLRASQCLPALLAHRHPFVRTSTLRSEASPGAALSAVPSVASEHVAALCSSMTSTDAGTPSKRSRVEDPEERLVLQVKKLSEKATIPTRGSEGAAGYDLSRYAAPEVPLPSGEA